MAKRIDPDTHRWAKLALLRMLARLLWQIRLGRELPPEPWIDGDTRPDVHRDDDGRAK